MLGLVSAVRGQVPAPPAPEKFKATLRYYIPAPRDQHVAQYDAMIRHLQRVGFEFDPPLEKHAETDREDRSKNYLTGYIRSENKLRLLDSLVVQSVLLIPFAPEEYKLPDGGDDPVMVRLELGGKYGPDRQRELSNQTRLLLRELGFKEPAGYDQRGYSLRDYTRIVGTIPRSKLDILNRDLRYHPAGWLGPIIPPNEIPSPLRDVNPVQVIEVLPDGAAVREVADAKPRPLEAFEKISDDLWELIKGESVSAARIRVQVGFVGTNEIAGRSFQRILHELAPGFIVEGQFGPYISGHVRLDDIKAIAVSPAVTFVRLPRAPGVDIDPALQVKGNNGRALDQSGVKEFHSRGYKGQGIRIAILDRDFRGWESLVQSGKLPKSTRLVDLTTELDPEIIPQPYRNGPKGIGHGTLCAQAAALAAPDAEVILVRVDVQDPYHLHDVLRYLQGGQPSLTVEQRNGDMLARAAQLRARRAFLLEERKPILDDFTDDTDQREYLEFLGPLYAWLYSNREWHRQRMDFHQNLEEEHRRREERYRAYLKAIESLDGIPIVVNALAWNSGYPLGSASPLSRALDEPGKGPLWFQAIGNTRGQSWYGPHRGVVGDPGMWFIPETEKLPKGRWTREINFLGWQPHLGEMGPDLPEKTRIRLTLQWREPHDPDYFLPPGDEDLYRKPLANLGLQLLRQRDPDTKKLPADAFEIIARTGRWPQRLEHLPGSSVYEHVLEVPLEDAGRFAVRVDKQVDSHWIFEPHPERKTPVYRLLQGLTPTGMRPLGAPTLPALESTWELRLRLFVEVIDETNRLKGRVVFADFPTHAGSIGIPMDARNVITVGAASFDHKPQRYSASGSPAGMELSRRPWLYAYDELELASGGAYGTSIANAFAAGMTAAMLSGKVTRNDVLQMLRNQEGQVLRIPIAKK